MKKHIRTSVLSLMIVTMSVLPSAEHLYAANNVLKISAFSEERSAGV